MSEPTHTVGVIYAEHVNEGLAYGVGDTLAVLLGSPGAYPEYAVASADMHRANRRGWLAVSMFLGEYYGDDNRPSCHVPDGCQEFNTWPVYY